MKKKQSAKAASNGRKLPAKTPRRRSRPVGADTPSRRRSVAQHKRKMTPRLKKALALFGQPGLAKICGVTRQGVQQWTDLPAKHALAVEKASAGKLTKEYLAPDFYPRLAP